MALEVEGVVDGCGGSGIFGQQDKLKADWSKGHETWA
jgi:hypothetical protein